MNNPVYTLHAMQPGIEGPVYEAASRRGAMTPELALRGLHAACGPDAE